MRFSDLTDMSIEDLSMKAAEERAYREFLQIVHTVATGGRECFDEALAIGEYGIGEVYGYPTDLTSASLSIYGDMCVISADGLGGPYSRTIPTPN